MSSYAFGCVFCEFRATTNSGKETCLKVIASKNLRGWLCEWERAGLASYHCGPDGKFFSPKRQYAAKDDAA